MFLCLCRFDRCEFEKKSRCKTNVFSGSFLYGMLLLKCFSKYFFDAPLLVNQRKLCKMCTKIP